MKTVAAAMMLAASLTVVAAPATAHADPVPTTDEVVAIMAKLTDPGIPAVNKADIVTPGFAPEEAQTIDDHLNRLNANGYLPFNFVVTDIQPAPDNFAGATVAVPYGVRGTAPGPLVLADQGGRWLITHETAMTALNVFWYNATRHIHHGGI
jgi:hypothetical protein